MPTATGGLALISAMITPALLILACGTLVASTAARLARIVDRVRWLSRAYERLWREADAVDFAEERRAEVERQLASHAVRSRLIQGSLTSFYVALGLFVATSIGIGLVAFLPRMSWLPGTLGIVGTLVLFNGCMLLIRETRLALSSVRSEMEFVLGLRDRHQQQRVAADAPATRKP